MRCEEYGAGSPYSSILTNKNMEFQAILFWIFALVLTAAALCVIFARNPVHSALFLVLSFFTASGLWMLLEAEMALMLGGRYFNLEGMPQPAAHAAGYSNTRELGLLIYTDYVYPFEIAAVILLVAIVAAIALTLRHRKDTKYINPAEQIKVRPVQVDVR